MAINTYALLKAAMANALDRTNLTNEIIDAIILFEAKINRRLAVRQQVTTATITMSSGSGTLPTDYLDHRRVTWQGDPKRELTYVTPSHLSAWNASSVSSNPIYFTIEGETIKVAPLSDTSLQMLYAQKVPALSDSATTNWLLTAHPDVYLYGSLVETAAYVTSDGDKGRAWNQLADQRIDEIWRLNLNQFSTMAQRVEVATP